MLNHHGIVDTGEILALSVTSVFSLLTRISVVNTYLKSFSTKFDNNIISVWIKTSISWYLVCCVVCYQASWFATFATSTRTTSATSARSATTRPWSCPSCADTCGATPGSGPTRYINHGHMTITFSYKWFNVTWQDIVNAKLSVHSFCCIIILIK